MWVCARAASSKGIVTSVPAWFRADFKTNLIKQGKIVTGRPCGSVAQWSECSHGMREVLGSSPGWAMCFFLPCDTYANNKGADHDCHLDVLQVNSSDSDTRIFLSYIAKMVKLAKFRSTIVGKLRPVVKIIRIGGNRDMEGKGCHRDGVNRDMDGKGCHRDGIQHRNGREGKDATGTRTWKTATGIVLTSCFL